MDPVGLYIVLVDDAMMNMDAYPAYLISLVHFGHLTMTTRQTCYRIIQLTTLECKHKRFGL